MKNIEVKYNENGKITNVSDNSLHFEQENESLCIKAQLTVDDDKSVRAYIKGPNNNSDVTDAITKDGEYYSLVIRNEYMSKGTLYIGFEVFNDSGYIERYEPLKVYIDGFINPGNSSSENVYVVTVDVAETETLEPDTPAYVENVGTQKDMRLKIGVPRGKDGEPGYTPVKGRDYFTADEQQSFKEDVLGDVETKVFDYYYTFDSMVEKYDEYTEPGIYKIKHVLGMHSKVVLMLVRRFSTNGVFQLKFSPNQITSRTGNVGEDGKITWEEWGKFATESYVEDEIDQSLETAKVFDNQVLVDSKAYTDELLATAMDMKVIADITTTQDVANVYITKDIDGNPINQYKDYFLLMQTRQTKDGALPVAVMLNDGVVHLAYQYILSSKPEWKRTWYMRSTYIGYFGEVSTSDAFSGSQYARITEFPSTAFSDFVNQGLLPTHQQEIVNYSSRNVSYDKVYNFIISAVKGQSFEKGSRFILLGRKAI